MLKKDKIKSIIAVVVFGSILISYFFFGKEVAKYTALFGFAVWLGTMYYLNKR